MNFCLDCGKECKPSAKRCVACSNLNQNKIAREYKYQKVQGGQEKVCVECSAPFKARAESRVVCSLKCLSKHKIRVANEKWEKRDKPIVKTKNKNLNLDFPVALDNKSNKE